MRCARGLPPCSSSSSASSSSAASVAASSTVRMICSAISGFSASMRLSLSRVSDKTMLSWSATTLWRAGAAPSRLSSFTYAPRVMVRTRTGGLPAGARAGGGRYAVSRPCCSTCSAPCTSPARHSTRPAGTASSTT